MRIAFLLAVVFLNGCTSVAMGRVTRYQTNGQQTLCWEPSRKMNGLADFLANRLETRNNK